MRAIVKETSGPGLAFREVERPRPGPDDVLIRVLKTSICGTDVHIDTWDKWAAATIKPPLVIGHEFVGEIAELGGHVSGLKIGEIVSGEGHLVCGQCRNCLRGRMHLCPHTKGVGVNRQGAFADYVCLPKTNVWAVNPKIPLHVASCFDPLGNAVHTATQFDVLGEDVLITGAGPIGCMAAAICRHAGARSVVVTDVNPYRLELARKMGATVALDVSKE
jgi:threonine 3-dehydrogenase